MAARLLIVLAALYLLAPGHPLSLLRGVPLDWLSLAALVTLGCLVFGFAGVPLTPRPPLPCAGEGEPDSASVPISGREDAMLDSAGSPSPAHGRGGRGVRGLSLALAVLLIIVIVKLLLWWTAPPYGLKASYYPSARIAGGPERSTETHAWTYTRIEQSPGQPGFALHFFNDVERFNYYEETDPSRYSLPFSVRYEGYLNAPADGPYPLTLSTRGVAALFVDGSPLLTVTARETPASDQTSASLTAGSHPVRLDFQYQGGAPPSLSLDGALELTVEPVGADALARDRYLRWLAIVLDALVLAGIAGAVALTIVSRMRAVKRAPEGRWALLERPLLAGLLLVILAYALVTTIPIMDRAVILEGGQDWLTYESYSRDILLNGPLMLLGEEIGEARPYFFQPFYPYYLAGLHWLTGEGLWGPHVLQIVGIGVTGVLVYYLGKRLFGAPAGVAALALLLALGLTQLDWIARKMLSENLYFIVLPAAMVLVTRAIDERRLRDVAWAGLILGVCAITRAPTLLFVPGAALILALGWRRAGEPWRRALVAFVLLGLCTASVAALVPIRNYVASGKPSLVATNGGATLLLAHQPTDRVRLSGIDRNPVYNSLKLDRATREVVEFARQDPLGYLWTLVPLGLYSIGISNGIEGSGLIAPDVLAITVLYVVAVLLLPAARTLRTWPLHLFIVIHLGIMMTFLPYVYGYRQVLPMQLLMLVFDGALLARLVGQAVSRRGERRRSGPGVESGATSQPLVEQRTTG